MVLHQLLLGLAGRVPDADLAAMRNYLAADRPAELAARLAAVIAAVRPPLTQAEMSRARVLLRRHEQDPGVVNGCLRLDYRLAAQFTFTEAHAGLPDCGVTDQAVMDCAQDADVIAVWRVFRHDADRQVARVYLCETRRGTDVAGLAARVQQALGRAGESVPKVEVFTEGTELSPYHDAAFAAAVLVVAEDRVPVRLARVFDGADTGGPYFLPDHPRLEGSERERLLSYLRAGERVLQTPGAMNDIVQKDRKGVVPVGFCSDGHWVWTEAVTYYLEHHHLRPEAGLVKHALGAPVRPAGRLNRLQRHRVLSALFAPEVAQPVWRTVARSWRP
jgi:hypothetical protein